MGVDTLLGRDFEGGVDLSGGHFIISFLTNLIQRYVIPRNEIERLDLVQANRQQELLQSKMFRKLSGISPEHLEAAKINDTIEQVFSWVGGWWDGMNTQLMLQSYIIIAKIVSVLSIAASLYIFNPWLCLIVLAAPLPSLYSMTAGQKLRFKFIKDNTKLTRRTGYFQTLMLSAAGKELKTLGLHDFFYGKWKALADEYTLKERHLIRNQTLLGLANDLLVSLANISGVVFAIVLLTMGRPPWAPWAPS
jgi:ATP-binding cassette subfamily B protein